MEIKIPAQAVPADVPRQKRKTYEQNFEQATKSSGRLFLFAGDQKLEHLNKDFFGPGIPDACNDPEHLFAIASEAPIGAFATQLGLVARYGGDYPDVSYVIKLNGKTDLVSTKQKDPLSLEYYSVDDVVEFADQSNLSIVGVGYTVYLGSEFEATMLARAAQIVHQAHKHGLLAILWMYPRGKSIKKETDPDLIAGAAGVGACLGADFVKVNVPDGKTSEERAKKLQQAVGAAGRTGVICSGGAKKDDEVFLQELADQLSIARVSGCAVGRNIHQRTRRDAVLFCEKLAKILF